MITSILYSNLNIDEIKVKKMNSDNIYKKCNYKTPDDFNLIASWNYNSDIIELWGKTKGNIKNVITSINNINIDKFIVNTKIYGKCIFVMHNDNININDNINDNIYKSLTLDIFNDFLKTIIETDNVNSTILSEENIKDCNIKETINEKQEIEEDDDNNSEYSYNSELTFELYCYSDDEVSL